MTRRKAKTKRIFLSVFLAIALCLFALVGCENTVSPLAYGEYLGQNIDECYELWGLNPQEDISFASVGTRCDIFLREPINHLGKKFFVRLTYPYGLEKDLAYANDKLDSVTYVRNYYKMSDEEAAEDAAELLKTLHTEYEKTGKKVGDSYAAKYYFGKIDYTADLSKEDLADMFELIRKSAQDGEEQGIVFVATTEWEFPEKYEKLDPEFLKTMEERHDYERTYCVQTNLQYEEGQFSFTVKHYTGRTKDSWF